MTLQPPMDAERANLDRRASYEPHGWGERFIVLLLRDRIESAVRTCAAASPGKALDLGCGRQPFRTLLASLGYQYLGFDVAQNRDGTVDVLGVIDGELPPELVERGPWQFLLCTEVLEHVADWPKAFGNLASLLAPGGRILITCPQVYPLHEEPYDFWRPTVYAIRHYADRSGLKVIHEEQAGEGWDVLGTVLGHMHVLNRGGGIVNRLLRKSLAGLRIIALHVLASPALRRRIELGSRFYLANIVVLAAADEEDASNAPAVI